MTRALIRILRDIASGCARRRSSVSAALVSVVAAFAFGGAVSFAQVQSADRPPEKPESLGVSPAKLYEAVSGYLETFRGGDRSKATAPERNREKPTYDFEAARPPEPDTTDYQALFDRHSELADARFRREEWDLALRSIERALEAAAKLGPQTDTARLREMLQRARVQAAKPSAPANSPMGEITNSVGMKLILIRPGTFLMGSSTADIRRIEADWSAPRDLLEPQEPAHAVEISRPYLMGKYEVTHGQFRRFVEETGYRTVAEAQGWGWVYDPEEKHWTKKQGASWRNPGFPVSDDLPVTMVCHEDAEAFCEWLNGKENRRYFLPTEAQWEYAARGGKDGQRFPWGAAYPDGKKLNMADRNSPVPWADRTVDDRYATVAPVGAYEPNGFWLYDMAGNVWELCADIYDDDAYDGAADRITVDPTGPRRGSKRVVRGGNWAFGAGIAMNAFRFGIEPDLCVDVNGFRVAAAPSDEDPIPHPEPRAEIEPDLSPQQSLTRLMAEVKKLAAEGRRMEARKLVQDFFRRTKDTGGFDGRPADVVKNVLESLIDITEDETLQTFENSLGMTMVRIPAGSFIMGSSETDIAWAMTTLARGQPISLENEYPIHKVRISRPFYISATEVTVGQFRRFVEETGYITDAEDAGGGQVFDAEDGVFETKEGSSWRNPGWTVDDAQPITMVSYYDALAFTDWLSAKERLPYKLPTEAQWEYAARGGLANAAFPWGDALPDGGKANFADKNTDFEWSDEYADDGYKYVAPVGSYGANGYGLYDMAGNVLEWVRDYYGEEYYRFTPEVDPEGPGQGESRVMRGGEWTFGAVNLRCAFRGWSRPSMAFYNGGFRVAIELSDSRRIFHFSEDFVTADWTPGPDQREVAGAVAREQERQAKIAALKESAEVEAGPGAPLTPPVRGLKVVDFTPRSDGRDAGLEKGDVIIEYHGERGLDATKFLALTLETRRKGIRPTLVFVRNGYEHTVRVAKGFLGVTVIDTSVRGPFKQAKTAPSRGSDDGRGGSSKPLEWL